MINVLIKYLKNDFFLGLLLIVSGYLLWFIIGENSFVLIHDNLDCDFVSAKIQLESEYFWGFNLDGTIEQVMGGLPRSFLRSGFNFTFLLLKLFKPFTAYLINHLIVHIIGYVGMYFLLKRYFVFSSKYIVLFGALCFGWLSYYHFQFGISVSGQPLLLFCFLNILNKTDKWFEWLFICLFPFYSFLVMSLPFFLPVLTLILIFDIRIKKKVNWKFILAMFILTFINLIVEFNLLYSTFFRSEELLSHRSIWNKFIDGQPNFSTIVNGFFNSLLHTQYHAGKLWPIPCIILVLVNIYLFKNKLIKRELVLISTISLIIIWNSINPLFVYFLEGKITLIKTFQSDRFNFLLPALWIVLFISVLDRIDYKVKINRRITIVLSCLMIVGIFANNKELINNLKLLGGKLNKPTYAQFFDFELFKEIDDYINQDKANYKTLSIGIHPSIAQMNGFYTADSYQNNYKLSYKNNFEKVIIAEISKDESLYNYFKYWGNRCYSFNSVSRKKYLIKKDSDLFIESLDYNFEKAKSMNIKYIFSNLLIKNSKDLKFHRKFKSKNSYWDIYLFELIE